jgi:hypothetical protein
MMIKLRGVCVDINKPRSHQDLKRLLTVCKSEVSTASGAKKEFINMIMQVIDSKLTKEYYSINQTYKYEEETKFA